MGWIAFIVILPVGLSVFGITGPLDFLSGSLGFFGSITFFILVFLGLILLRVFFGSDTIISPMIISLVMALLLFAVCFEIGFLKPFSDFTGSIVFLGNKPLIFLSALTVILLGIIFSYFRKLAIGIQLLVLVFLPIAFIVVSHYMGWFTFLSELGGS